MNKLTLFLLKPNFEDNGKGPYFCPDCALVEGFLTYTPGIEMQLDIRRVDFAKPRKEVVELLGEEHQGCPVLVFDESTEPPPEAKRSEETGRAFISEVIQLCDYLGRTFGTARPH